MNADAQIEFKSAAPSPAVGGATGRRRIAFAAGGILLCLAGALAMVWLAPQGWRLPLAILAAGLGAALALAAVLFRRQQRALAALRQDLAAERRRLRDYIDLSGEIFWETDTEHRLTAIAGGATDLIEGEPYRHLGKQPWTLALDRDDHEKWSKFRAMLAARKTFRGVGYVLQTDDGPAWRQVSGMPRYDAGGRFVGYRGVSVEKTLKAQREAELQLFRQALDGFVDGVVITGLADSGYPIRYANPAYERLTGYSEADLLGRPGRLLLGPDQDPATLQGVQDDLRAGRAINLSLTKLHRDGRPLHVALGISPIRDGRDTIQWFVAIHHDMTGEREATRALSAVSERLSLAVRATGIGIYDIDIETGAVTWDETMERLYGLAPGSFGGDFATWQRYLHPDDLLAHVEATRDAMRKKHGLVTRTRIVRPDGTIRVLQFRTAVLRDDAGIVTRLIGVNRDVTEEHEAQEHLRVLSQRLTLATEAAGIGIFDVDLKAGQVTLDANLQAIYGIDPEQFDGRLDTWRRQVHPDDIARIDADFRIYRHTSRPHTSVMRIRRPDGSKRILREHAVILRDETGNPVRIIGVNWDITEDQEAQASLEHLTRRLTLTTRAAGIGFFDWQEGSEGSSWDDTLRDLHGVGPDFDGGLQNWLELMDPDERPRAERFVADRFRSRKPDVLTYRLRRHDGAVRHLQMHVAPEVDGQGRVVRLLGATWDVTEAREAERHLRRARDTARAANEAKDRFLATMSHELRTPLNAILGFSEVIREQAVGPIDNPAYPEYAQDIHSSGVHLLSLVNDLIDIARVQNAKVRLSESRLSLDDLLQRLPALLGDNAFAHDFPEPLSRALLRCDPRLLAQVLVNLLSNARKHAGKTSAVHLGAGRLHSGALALWVTDEGPGIAAEDQRLVLEPFGRMAATEEAAIPGVGLGLPIARSYVEAHGGQLFLHSAPGLGTTVGLILPADRLAWPDAPETPEPLPRITGDWPTGSCLGCLQQEAAGIVRGSDSTGLLLEHGGRCSMTGAEGDACAHWGEQLLRRLGGIAALSDPMRPRQAFATCRLLADGTETECLVEVRRGARTPCRAFVTPVSGGIPAKAGPADGA